MDGEQWQLMAKSKAHAITRKLRGQREARLAASSRESQWNRTSFEVVALGFQVSLRVQVPATQILTSLAFVSWIYRCSCIRLYGRGDRASEQAARVWVPCSVEQ